MIHKKPFKIDVPSQFIPNIDNSLENLLNKPVDFFPENRYLYFSGEDPYNFNSWDFGKLEEAFKENDNPEISFKELLSFFFQCGTSKNKENSFNQYDEHEKITGQMSKIYREKNADYGDSFNKSLNKHGMIAAVVRIEDKFLRFENIVKTGKIEVKSESLEDTLIDMANYCIMSVIHLRSKNND